MIEIFEECVKLLRAGQNAMLVTVFESRGSAPRAAGARMLVRGDASILGTVGGGRLEHDAIGLSGSLLQQRRSAVQAFELTGKDVAGMDMICGGSGELWLHFLEAGNPAVLSVCQRVLEVLTQRKQAWLITELEELSREQDREYGLVAGDGSVCGQIKMSPELIEDWVQCPDATDIQVKTRESRRFLVEAISPGGTVHVFGAGHVSQQVVPLCKNVGFQAVVLDDRSEFACERRFPAASCIITLDSFDSWAGWGKVDADSYVVILTRGHAHDKTVLAQALRTSAGYIGMIGSRRKRDAIYQALLQEGFTAQDLQRVYSPIGLDIGAETPAELAVSIVGELIKNRAEKRAGRRQTCC